MYSFKFSSTDHKHLQHMAHRTHPIRILFMHQRHIALHQARIYGVARPVAELYKLQLLAAKLCQACDHMET